jgi:hypothetical protein
MDQNTAIILAALIGAGASIVTNIVTGVVLPYVTQRLNKNEKEREEKKAIIKQVYQTLLSAHDLCVQLAYDVRNSRKNDLDTIGRIKEISSTKQITTMLIGIDLPLLKEELKEYEDNITAYWNRMGGYYAARDQMNSTTRVVAEEELIKAELAYKKPSGQRNRLRDSSPARFKRSE